MVSITRDANGNIIKQAPIISASPNVNNNVSALGTSSFSAAQNIASLGIFNTITLNGNNITASASQINYNIVTPGTATASKSLVLDSSKNITGINNVYTTGLFGINNNNPGKQLEINNSTGQCLRLTYNNSTGITNLYYSDFLVSSSGNLTIKSSGSLISTDSSNDFNISSHNGTTTGLQLGGVLVTVTAAELNYNSGITAGTAKASSSLVLDSSKNITGINNIYTIGKLGVNQNNPGKQVEINHATGQCLRLTYNNSTGSSNLHYSDLLVSVAGNLNLVASGTAIEIDSTNNFNVASHNGSTLGLQLGGILITATANELNTNAGVTAGTASAGKTVVLNSSRNISNINAISCTSLTVNGVAITSSGGGGGGSGGTDYTTGVTPGTAMASKSLVLDANSDITGINSLTTTSLTLGSTALTSTATELNTLAGVTAGTASASKAVVLDASIGIGGLGSVSCSSLTVNGVSITGGSSGSITGLITGTVTSSSANTINNGLLLKTGYSGTTTSGIGGSLILQSQNGSGTFVNTLQIQSSLTTVTNAAEQSNTLFIVKKGGADYTSYSCSNTGNIMYNNSTSVLQLIKTPFAANGGSTTGATGLTELTYSQYDSSGTLATFGKIQCSATNVTSGSYASSIIFLTQQGGTERTPFTINHNGSTLNTSLSLNANSLTCGAITTTSTITAANLIGLNTNALISNGVAVVSGNTTIRPFVGPVTNPVSRNISTGGGQYNTAYAWDASFFVKTTYSESYTFSIIAAYTYHKMWINGVLLSQNWSTTNTTATTYNATSTISCIANGFVYIYIQYLPQTGGSVSTNVFWQSTSQTSGSIPLSAIYGTSPFMMGHFTSGVIAHDTLEIASSLSTATTPTKFSITVDSAGNGFMTPSGGGMQVAGGKNLTIAGGSLTCTSGNINFIGSNGNTNYLTLNGGFLLTQNDSFATDVFKITPGTPGACTISAPTTIGYPLTLNSQIINLYSSFNANLTNYGTYQRYVYTYIANDPTIYNSPASSASTLSFPFTPAFNIAYNGAFYLAPTTTDTYTIYVITTQCFFKFWMNGRLVATNMSNTGTSVTTSFTFSATTSRKIMCSLQILATSASSPSINLQWSYTSVSQVNIPAARFSTRDCVNEIALVPTATADNFTLYSTYGDMTRCEQNISTTGTVTTTAYGSAPKFNFAGGNVGINVSSPSYQLELSTDSAAKPSTSSWTVSSDSRLKDNIQDADLDICYNNIKNLKLVRYTWKDDVYTTEQVPDRTKVGWIAQDVEKVIPKAVTQVEAFGYKDCRTLNVDQIYASMYGAIQKLMEKNEALEARIAILENK